MPQLTDAQLADFQNLYRSNFGREISKEEALEQGTKLVQLMAHAVRHATHIASLEKTGTLIAGK